MPSATDLHIVTGKGGTGKTTVAAALALALAQRGRKVLLCEVENRQGIAQIFDVAPLPYEEVRIASGVGGGTVFALAIDAESALLEYLDLFYRLGRAGKALDRFGVIDFATTIAPGVRDVLLTGKVYEVARRGQGGSRDAGQRYDAIVMDAPPTGRINRFLNVSSDVAGLAKVGPIRRQADAVIEMMRAESTRVHLVTALEEMPVQETLDGITALGADRLPVGSVIVNLTRPPLITAETTAALREQQLEVDRVASVLERVGLDGQAAADLIEDGHDHLVRQDLQDTQRERLLASGRPVVELPLLDDRIDLSALITLAEILSEEIA